MTLTASIGVGRRRRGAPVELYEDGERITTLKGTGGGGGSSVKELKVEEFSVQEPADTSPTTFARIASVEVTAPNDLTFVEVLLQFEGNSPSGDDCIASLGVDGIPVRDGNADDVIKWLSTGNGWTRWGLAPNGHLTAAGHLLDSARYPEGEPDEQPVGLVPFDNNDGVFGWCSVLLPSAGVHTVDLLLLYNAGVEHQFRNLVLEVK